MSQTRDKLICYLNGVIVKHSSVVKTFEKRKLYDVGAGAENYSNKIKVGSKKFIFKNSVKNLCLGDYSCFPCLHQSGGRQ